MAYLKPMSVFLQAIIPFQVTNDIIRKSPRGVLAKVLNCSLEVRDHSYIIVFYTHTHTHTHTHSGTRSVMDIIVRNEHGDPSSYPGRGV